MICILKRNGLYFADLKYLIMLFVISVIIYFLYKSGQIKSRPLFLIARFIMWFVLGLFGLCILAMLIAVIGALLFPE